MCFPQGKKILLSTSISENFHLALTPKNRRKKPKEREWGDPGASQAEQGWEGIWGHPELALGALALLRTGFPSASLPRSIPGAQLPRKSILVVPSLQQQGCLRWDIVQDPTGRGGQGESPLPSREFGAAFGK